MRILLDVDEVLADFTGAALALHGWTREKFEAVRTANGHGWDITETLRISADEFWRPIHLAEPEFWANLDPLPWMVDTVMWMMGMARIGHEWYLVTSPSRGDRCIEGKRVWVRTHLGEPAVHKLIPTGHKHLMANPNTVLIDDMPKNVNRFREAGGRAILFPQEGNCNRGYLPEPMALVKEKFNAISIP